MFRRPSRLTAALLVPLLALTPAPAADPTDNPVATFYAGPEGYPAWTDGVNWANVVNMKTYAKGKTDFEKFEKARDELAETGRRPLLPRRDVRLHHQAARPRAVPPRRGRHPRRGPGRPARRGRRQAGPAHEVRLRLPQAGRRQGAARLERHRPHDREGAAEGLKDVDRVGIAWVHLVGATVYFGPQVDWGKSWAAGRPAVERQGEEGLGRARAGRHPPVRPARRRRQEVRGRRQGPARLRLRLGGRRRGWTTSPTPGTAPTASTPSATPPGSPSTARASWWPTTCCRGAKGTSSTARRRRRRPAGPRRLLTFDYGKTCGIDVNKELLRAGPGGRHLPGLLRGGGRGPRQLRLQPRPHRVQPGRELGHGRPATSTTGLSAQGGRQRLRRRPVRRDDAGRLDRRSARRPDNRSRAFDLAGRNLWIDRNRFANTGSAPGGGGEGIVCRPAAARRSCPGPITHNAHARGAGSAGGMGERGRRLPRPARRLEPDARLGRGRGHAQGHEDGQLRLRRQQVRPRRARRQDGGQARRPRAADGRPPAPDAADEGGGEGLRGRRGGGRLVRRVGGGRVPRGAADRRAASGRWSPTARRGRRPTRTTRRSGWTSPRHQASRYLTV